MAEEVEREGNADGGEPALEHDVLRLDLAVGKLGEKRRTPQGGIIAPANLTRTGVFSYRQADGSTRRELRHPDDVFHPDSLATYPHAPVTIDHPGRVAPDNWKTHAVGTVGHQLRPAGDFLAGELHIQHDDAVERAEKGDLHDVSCGYTCDVDPIGGVHMGQPYDARQRNIRINHVAIGPKGWGRMGTDTALRLDAASAVSGESVTDEPHDYLRADHTETEIKTMADPSKPNADLEKANADLAKANEDLAKARKDAADATSDKGKLEAQAKADKAEIEALKAQNQVLTLQAERARNDGQTDEKKKLEAAAQQKMVEELITLRADAASVFSTAEDPTGKAWPSAGKDADAIRREVLKFLEPTVRLDSLDGNGLRGVYEVAMSGKRRADAEREKLLKAATDERRADGMPPGDDDDDDAPNAEKARKDMLKKKADGWKQKRDKRPGARS